MVNDPNDHETADLLASSEDSAAAPPATLAAPPAPPAPAVSETVKSTLDESAKPTVDQLIDLWFNTEFRDNPIIRTTEDWNFMRASVSRLKDLLAAV